MPWDQPNEDENLQSLLDAHFIQNQRVNCVNQYCHAVIDQTSSIVILDPQPVIVIALNRTRHHPGLAAEREANRNNPNWVAPPPEVNHRDVSLSEIIEVPCLGGERARFELAATIEHTGGAEAGHYAAHLRYNNDYYAASDNLPILRSAESHYNVEKSTIFLFKKLEDDAMMMM